MNVVERRNTINEKECTYPIAADASRLVCDGPFLYPDNVLPLITA
jgi:hypothetical protein